MPKLQKVPLTADICGLYLLPAICIRGVFTSELTSGKSNFMRNLLFLLLTFFAVTIGAAQDLKIIRNVSVVSMKSAKVDKNRDVLIENGRIAAIGKSGRLKFDSKTQIIDGAGKFLMPGLWDMHVHAWDAGLFFPLFLSNGITGARDMGGVLEPYLDWRKKTFAEPDFLAPKSFVGGIILNGAPSNADFFADVRTPEIGREKVRELKKRGADFIKVYSLLPRPVYEAIADECVKQNITFAGHLPFAISLSEASASGQKSLEHLRGFALAASSDEANLRAELLKLAAVVQQSEKYDFPNAIKAYDYEANAPLDSFDQRKFEKIARILRKNDTYVSPTLTAMRGTAMRGKSDYRTSEFLKYFPNYIKSIIIPTNAPTTAEIASDDKIFALDLEMVKILHRTKVKILAGTDAPNPYVYPGFSLHEELEFYVRCGMSPFEALQTATTTAAEFTDKSKDLGTVETGKIADLVLLEANPLDTISNTRRIAAVFLDGRYLSKEKLAAMREKVLKDYNY